MKMRHLALAALCLVALPDVATAQRPATADIVWPAPPEAARIRYVGHLKGEQDIGKQEGFFSRMRNTLAGTDAADITSMDRPQDVYNPGNGRIYVADATKARVLVFDTELQEIRVIGDEGQGRLGKPMGIDGDRAGHIYVADGSASRIVAYDEDGTFLAGYGGPDVLHNPADVAVDAERDALWVVDAYLHQVLKFSISTGELLLRLGVDEGDLASKREELANMRAGIHGAGMLPEEDPEADVEGEPVPGHDGETVNVPRDLTENRGSESGEFRYPGFVAVAPDGTVYVTDQMNFRVQAFTPEGEFIREIGRHGRVPGTFARPKGIAVDSEGHLYVADAIFNNVQIFDPEGRLLLYFATGGQGEGEIFMPLGLSIDGNDRIWVADRINERVQIFQYLSVPEGGGGGGSD